MAISIVLLIVGLALLIKGADWFVDGASSLARKYNISDLTIGLTIVAFGTSAPELVVNSIASYDGLDNVVLGNIIGSCNFNLFIILGIAGLIAPLVVESNTVRREIPLSMISIIILILFANSFFLSEVDQMGVWEGVALLVLFGVFLFSVYQQLKQDPVEPELGIAAYSTIKLVVLLAFGLGGLVYGGKLAVDHAVEIATQLGWSEKIIGLTVLAAGTSLPELATTVIAAIKGNNSIAIGNVIGSNLFNILFILSISMLIDPVIYDISFNLDLLILLVGTVFLFLVVGVSKQKRMDRWAAFLLLAFYIAYTIYLVLKEL